MSTIGHDAINPVGAVAGDSGIECRACRRAVLRVTDCSEAHTGALRTQLVCPDCTAGGLQVVNPPGRKAIRERGAALRGERR